MFQSQTRRLLPRNLTYSTAYFGQVYVSIADATLASSQPDSKPGCHRNIRCFNRRRDACFLATETYDDYEPLIENVSIADATLASSQLVPAAGVTLRL